MCGELVSPRPRFIFGYWGSQTFLSKSVSPPVFERISSSRCLHHFLALVSQYQQLQGPVRVNMRAVRFHGRGDIRLDEVEEPVCGSGQVKVRSTYRQYSRHTVQILRVYSIQDQAFVRGYMRQWYGTRQPFNFLVLSLIRSSRIPYRSTCSTCQPTPTDR